MVKLARNALGFNVLRAYILRLSADLSLAPGRVEAQSAAGIISLSMV
jgi:hypothetical protein